MKAFRLCCHAFALLLAAGIAILWFKTRSVEYLADKCFDRGGRIQLFAHDGRLMIQYYALVAAHSDWNIEPNEDAPSLPREDGVLISLKESDDQWHWASRRVPNPPRGGGRGGGGGGDGGRGVFSSLKPGDLAGWTAILPLWALALPPAAFWSLLATRTLRTARRTVSGHCPACGYDLRASPNSCPECGRSASSDA